MRPVVIMRRVIQGTRSAKGLENHRRITKATFCELPLRMSGLVRSVQHFQELRRFQSGRNEINGLAGIERGRWHPVAHEIAHRDTRRQGQ